MAFDSQPAYSRDGKRIAFIRDREGAENLFLADADGSLETGRSFLATQRFSLPGGNYVANDIGGSITGYRLDVFMGPGSAGISAKLGH